LLPPLSPLPVSLMRTGFEGRRRSPSSAGRRRRSKVTASCPPRPPVVAVHAHDVDVGRAGIDVGDRCRPARVGAPDPQHVLRPGRREDVMHVPPGGDVGSGRVAIGGSRPRIPVPIHLVGVAQEERGVPRGGRRRELLQVGVVEPDAIRASATSGWSTPPPAFQGSRVSSGMLPWPAIRRMLVTGSGSPQPTKILMMSTGWATWSASAAAVGIPALFPFGDMPNSLAEPSRAGCSFEGPAAQLPLRSPALWA